MDMSWIIGIVLGALGGSGCALYFTISPATAAKIKQFLDGAKKEIAAWQASNPAQAATYQAALTQIDTFEAAIADDKISWSDAVAFGRLAKASYLALKAELKAKEATAAALAASKTVIKTG